MEIDEKRYIDNNAEQVRTNIQGISNQSHDLLSLDSIDWAGLQKTGKPVVLDLRCGDGKLTVERFSKYLDNVQVVIGVDCSKNKIDLAKKYMEMRRNLSSIVVI